MSGIDVWHPCRPSREDGQVAWRPLLMVSAASQSAFWDFLTSMLKILTKNLYLFISIQTIKRNFSEMFPFQLKKRHFGNIHAHVNLL